MTPTFLVARSGPCDAESASAKEDDHAALCWQALPQPSQVSPVDVQKSYAGTPTIGNAGSLWFPFHSPGATEAGQCGVERRPPVQERSELQAHEGTMLQSLAVEVRKGSGRSAGPCHTSSASFLGTPHRFATVAVRYAEGQLSTFGVAAVRAAISSCARKLLRARLIPAAPSSLTAASNSTLLCSARMTSRS